MNDLPAELAANVGISVDTAAEAVKESADKKVRVVFRQKGTSGKHLGKPPYGYRLDPSGEYHLQR